MARNTSEYTSVVRGLLYGATPLSYSSMQFCTLAEVQKIQRKKTKTRTIVITKPNATLGMVSENAVGKTRASAFGSL